MKIPTYDRQTAAPRSGGGQFLTAQLNPSAMMAPSRAAGAAFKSLAQTAGQVADLAFRKAEIDADSQAIQATSAYTVELDDIAQRSLLLSPLQAETAFQRDAALAKKKATVGFNRLATDAFNRRSATPTSTASITFKRTNNARYIDAANAVVRSAIDNAVDVGSNTGLTEAQRLLAVSDGRREINSGLTRRGPDATALSHLSLDEELAENTLASALNASSDPLGTAEAFRDGTLSDPVLDNLRLNQTQRDKIANDGFERATKLIEQRQKQRKDQDEAGQAALDAQHRSILNIDVNNPTAVEAAIETHERLLAAGYYETTAKREAVEGLLFPESPPSEFVATQESIDLEHQLEELEARNELTFDRLAEAKNLVSPTFYGTMLQAIEGDRSEAESDSITLFKDVYGYTAEAEASGALKAPARAAFRASSRALRKFMRGNRNASYNDVVAEAEKIVAENRDRFESAMSKIQRANLVGLVQGVSEFGADPSDNNVTMQQVIELATARLAATPAGQTRLRSELLAIINKAGEQFQLEVFDR